MIVVGAVLIPKSGYEVDGGDDQMLLSTIPNPLSIPLDPYGLLVEKEKSSSTNMPVC